ncbi:type VI secretion system Vgr family protein [Piscinibacterium candidicorallinum]
MVTATSGAAAAARSLLAGATPLAQLGTRAGLAASPLLFHRLESRSRLNSTEPSTLQFLSLDAGIDLHGLLGEHFTTYLRLNLAEAKTRPFDGIVQSARQLDQVGRFTRYEVTLRPWLWFLSLTTDCKIFQDASVPEILAAVLGDHAIAKSEFKLTHAYPKRPYTVQYRESDLALINRLCELEGITYHVVHHPAEGAGSGAGALLGANPGPGSHSIVFTDSAAKHADCPGYETVPFHAQVGSRREDEQALLSWTEQRSIAASSVTLSDYAFLKPGAPQTGGRADTSLSAQLQGAHAEIYEAPGQFHKESREESTAEHQAQVLLESIATGTRTWTGATSARGLSTGGCFTLTKHPQAGQNGHYLITGERCTVVFASYEGVSGTEERPSGRSSASELQAAYSRRGGSPSLEEVLSAGGAYFHAEISAQRSEQPHRPARTTPRPQIHSIQTATVVGSGAGEIHTDAHGRIKVHFHWDRYGQRNGQDSCWLRVAQPWAGANWGAQFLPRVGQEVIVSFVEGDPDAPIATGRLYNAEQRAAAFSDAGSLPGNQALAGFKSKELNGSGYNQLLFDDTAGQVRLQLATTHGASQLNLGYLMHPRADQAEEAGAVDKPSAEPRGEGFELRTDHWGAIRAAKGLLITTDGRAQAVGGALDRNELIAVLQEALTLAQSLTENASQAGAATAKDEKDAKGPDHAPQETQLKEVKGLAAGANNEPDNTDPSANHLALHSPAGIAMASPHSVTLAAGQTLDQVAAKHVQLTSGQQTHVHAGTGIRQYTHSGGIHQIAHQGKVLIQSQHDDTVINAEQAIHLSASQKHILLEAKEHITLATEGGGYITLKGGNVEIGLPGAFTPKASKHAWQGAAKMAMKPVDFPDTKHWIGVNYLDPMGPASGLGITGVAYKILFDDGSSIAGKTDGQGKGRHENVDNKVVKEVIYEPRTPDDEKPHAPLSDLTG